MKGQKTVAMVVSMSIISIVILTAVNVIQDSATSFQESDVLDSGREEIRASCTQKCTEAQTAEGESAVQSAVEYCTDRYKLGDRGGKVLGAGYNSYCSDGVRCFNVHSCSFRSQELNAENCREIMCSYFNESSSTGERVHSYFAPGEKKGDMGAGTCDLSSIEDSAGYEVDNWWKENFEAEEGDYNAICS